MTVIQQSKLFTPIQVGEYELKHRIVMAPLTRLRAATKTAIPSEWAETYYAQRASGESRHICMIEFRTVTDIRQMAA